MLVYFTLGTDGCDGLGIAEPEVLFLELGLCGLVAEKTVKAHAPEGTTEQYAGGFFSGFFSGF